MTYLVKLIDGTEFIGKRPWWYAFAEGWAWYHFKVISNNHLTPNSIINVRNGAIVYMVKQ